MRRFLKQCLLVLIMSLGMSVQVKAAAAEPAPDLNEEQELITGAYVWNYFDIGEIADSLTQMTETENVNYREIFYALMEGNLSRIKEMLMPMVRSVFLGNALGYRPLFARLLILGIGASFCGMFAGFVPEKQTGDICFQVMFLLMLAMTVTSFRTAAGSAVLVMQNLAEYVPMFLPAFSSTVLLACGSSTAAGYHLLLVMVAGGIVRFLEYAILPLIYIYLLLAAMNGLWPEEKLTLLLDLLKKGVELALKISTGFVAGIGLVQSMILPAFDAAKGMAIQKAVSFLPGIGNISDQVYRMLAGSFVLIKNSVGIFCAIGLVILVLMPLVRVVCLIIVLKLSAALLGIVCDKRLVHALNRIGDAALLLAKSMIAVVTMLFLILSVVCSIRGRV